MSVVWLIVGGLIGAALVALALRGRILALRAELHHQRLASDERVRAVEEADRRLEATFKALSADALRSNNQQFIALARESLGRYQTEARGSSRSARRPWSSWWRRSVSR